MATQPTCRACTQPKPLATYRKRDGTQGFRSICTDCRREQNIQWRRDNPRASRRYWEKANAKRAASRATNTRTPHWIIQDTRKADKKAGRDNDLTKNFVREEIAKGCSYCGESKIRMTLDRINNDKGHTMDNVVPACIRCNYTRKDMPYEAWLVVAKGMREARKAGLFAEWTGRAR